MNGFHLDTVGQGTGGNIWADTTDLLDGKVKVLGFAGDPEKSTRLSTMYSSEETDADVSLEDLEVIDPDGLLGTVVIYKLVKVLKRD